MSLLELKETLRCDISRVGCASGCIVRMELTGAACVLGGAVSGTRVLASLSPSLVLLCTETAVLVGRSGQMSHTSRVMGIKPGERMVVTCSRSLRAISDCAYGLAAVSNDLAGELHPGDEWTNSGGSIVHLAVVAGHLRLEPADLVLEALDLQTGHGRIVLLLLDNLRRSRSKGVKRGAKLEYFTQTC